MAGTLSTTNVWLVWLVQLSPEYSVSRTVAMEPRLALRALLAASWSKRTDCSRCHPCCCGLRWCLFCCCRRSTARTRTLGNADLHGPTGTWDCSLAACSDESRGTSERALGRSVAPAWRASASARRIAAPQPWRRGATLGSGAAARRARSVSSLRCDLLTHVSRVDLSMRLIAFHPYACTSSTC